MLRNPQIAMMVAGLEQMRNGRYSISQEAYKTTTRKNFSTRNNAASKQNKETAKFQLQSNSGSISDATAQKFTNAVDRLLNWDPSISIELLERKQNLYNKITKGGLK
jgi:hypothetical protein